MARELDQRNVGEYSLVVTGASANKVTLQAERSTQDAGADTTATGVE